MPFTFLPATVDDAPEITSVFHAAFANDDIMSHFYTNVPASVTWERDVKYYQELITEGMKYGERVTKVVDEASGKIVAYSGWQYPYTLTEEQRKVKEARDNARKDDSPEGSNKPLIKEFFTQLINGRKKWIVPGKTFFLHILAVHPSYQRLGLGTRLIQPGLEAADAAGGQTYVEASPFGLPLYLRHGWKPVDEIVIDMRPYGGDEIKRHKSLMREPGAGSMIGETKG